MTTPGTADAQRSPPVAANRGRFDALSGYGLSIAIHALLILCFIQISWLVSGVSTGVGETDVGVVAEDKRPGIQSGDDGLAGAELSAIQPEALALSQPAAAPLEPIESVAAVGLPAASAPMEAILGIESGSAEAQADWAGFAAGTGGGGGGKGGGGGDFFGLQAKGAKFIYVLDRSFSMAELGKLEAVKRELARSVMALKRHAKFYVIFYNQSFELMPAAGLVDATDDSKRKYLAWANTMRPEDGTDPTKAMLTALSMKPDAVWLLSDGLFPDAAADVIREANVGGKIQIHTIAFCENSGEPVLQRIAEENRGLYRFVPPSSAGLPKP
jgi:hypothetical protein